MISDSPIEFNSTAISEENTVLDIGTKDGKKLTGCTGTVIGIDIDSSRFAEDTETKLVLGDGRQLPFRTNVFDYVYCSAVIEHVDSTRTLIHEAARVLKRSGVAYFDFPNRISLLQPHNGIPRYYSLLPKSVGRKMAPYLLTEEKTEYYKRRLFPLTPITARRHLHANFEKVEYTMQISGELVSERPQIRWMFRSANRIIEKPPFRWPFEVLWPDASYRCENPKQRN